MTQTKALNLGLNFVKNNSGNKFQAKVALHKFFRKMALKVYFHQEPSFQMEAPLFRQFKPKSVFTPPVNNVILKSFMKSTFDKFKKIEYKRPKRFNLSFEQENSLKALRDDQNTLIRPADKGGSIVIQDMKDHMNKAWEHLTDSTTYMLLTRDPTNKIKKILESITDLALEDELIDASTRRFLCVEFPVIPILYFLPKIHKLTFPPPLRPIVSGRSSIFEGPSKYIDSFLTPVVINLPRILKDTSDFLRKLVDFEPLQFQVNKDFGSIFSTLLPGANAMLAPPEGRSALDGLEFKVALGNTWKENLTELSGGQRSLVALSLILAMLLFKPAPIYILDEVDAALDLSHTQNIGQMLRTHFRHSQFIVVSLKDGMFNNANVLFKTKFVDGVSTVARFAQSQNGVNGSAQQRLDKAKSKGKRN